jgi:superfamily II DNA or RNA helicase
MTIQKLNAIPISVGAAAVYPFKRTWSDLGHREAKYPDENGDTKFDLFRYLGPGALAPHKSKILVPRNMAPSIPEDLRVRGADVKFTSAFVPRKKEQTRVVQETVALLKQGHSFVTKAPTGFGKTFVGSEVIAQVGKKTLVVVHKEELLDQWLKAFKEVLGLDFSNGVGLIQGDRCDTVGKKIVLAMVQSIAKDDRYPEFHFRDFGFAVWDEVHRVGADFFSNSCFRVPALLRWGVSASDRKDGREEVIEAHIGPVKVESTEAPMGFKVIVQDSGWHCPQRRKVDKAGRVVMDGGKAVMVPIEHSPGKCAHIVRMLVHNHNRNKIITNFAVQAVKNFGRKVIIQSETREHLEILASLIAASGVPSHQITFYVGGLTKAQREKAKLGSFILATYQQTAEGTDIPELDTLIMATPKSDVLQIVGRVRRFLENKLEPLVFDLRDDSSPVFTAYAKSRDKWYASQGAKVTRAKVTPPHIDKQGKSVTIASSKT